MKKLTILLILVSNIAVNVYSQIVSIDNTFGQNGMTLIPNTSSISLFDFDNHGNIIAAGITLIDNKKYVTIAKTNPDGVIDENFNDNGLIKITDYSRSFPHGLKITSDNKIIVIGSFSKVVFQDYATIIMKFNENGTVDDSFGDNGRINLNIDTRSIISLNFENDDFMLITIKDYQYPYIVKYNYEGKIETSFGENGTVYLTNSIVPYCMKILNNGSIIIAGTYNTWPNTELGVCRLTHNGELDTNFANNGLWHMNIMQDFDLDHEYFSNVIEDREGNLLISGSGAFLSKFSPNGIFDTDFGENGFYWLDFWDSNTPVLQIGDKYIIAGWYDSHSHKLISVNKDGRYGNFVYDCGIYYLDVMKLQENNKIILGGGYNDIFALERVVVDLETSIKPNDYSSVDLIISPNPVKENLHFSNETTFEIFDIQGKILLKSIVPVKSVNIANFKTGIYFVRINNRVWKLIKE